MNTIPFHSDDSWLAVVAADRALNDLMENLYKQWALRSKNIFEPIQSTASEGWLIQQAQRNLLAARNYHRSIIKQTNKL